MTVRRPFVLLALLLAAVAFAAALRAGGDVQPAGAAIPSADPLAQYLHVGGVARTTIEPDRADFSLSVQVVGSTSASTSSKAASRMRTVIEKLNALGISAASIRTQNIYVFPRPRKGKPPVWTVNVGLQVTTNELARVGEFMGAALAAGATSVQGPQLSVVDSRAAYELALAAAVDDASHKAAAIATKLGKTIVGIRSVDDVGSAQTFGYQTTGQEFFGPVGVAFGNFPILNGTVDVPATVDVVFAYGP